MIKYVNNHIHTTYSFSPYTPREAVRKSAEAGLLTCGLMDHDSIAGAEEFIKAGREFDIPVTVGMELRVNMSGTPFADRRLNNPDQKGIAYVALHAVPRRNIRYLNDYMQPYRERRNIRNALMCGKLNEFLQGSGLYMDFEKDVLPLSMFHRGGTVTERHIAFSLAKKMRFLYGSGASLLKALGNMGVSISGRIEDYLLDEENPYYEYDLLGVIKSDILSRFYVDAAGECMSVAEFIKLGGNVGAITAYAYLGDVTNSVTGDKARMAFEDAYLEELFACLKGMGFQAATYMPTRNTPAQLMRVRELCLKEGFLEISGEDINSPRQDFRCRALENPGFAHLIDAAFMLVEDRG